MWGLRTNRWRPWPSDSPPQLQILAQMPQSTPVVAMLGDEQAGPRGRYGLVGVPRQVQSLAPGQTQSIVDDRPRDALRVVALGYEMGAPGAFLEAGQPPRGQPYGLALDIEDGIIVDHTHRIYRSFGRPLDADEAISLPPPPRAAPSARLDPTVSDTEHKRRIRVALEHIAAGDIYQANIARRLAVRGELDPITLARRLYELNAVAHGAYLRAGGIELLSNSMETLLTFEPEARRAQSFPIKGTYARRPGAAAQLCADPKERAEHVMIVDLVRNDLGKVCVPGSVGVPELMGAHGFNGVWHGISTVSGTLAAEHTPGELLAGVFPGGSITGAPKRRAMQIIGDIENEARGFYTGSIALLTPEGRMSCSILIRTLVKDRDGWSLSVGGGIVADSHPDRELQETWHKVRVFQHAMQTELSVASSTTR